MSAGRYGMKTAGSAVQFFLSHLQSNSVEDINMYVYVSKRGQANGGTAADDRCLLIFISSHTSILVVAGDQPDFILVSFWGVFNSSRSGMSLSCTCSPLHCCKLRSYGHLSDVTGTDWPGSAGTNNLPFTVQSRSGAQDHLVILPA